MKNPRCCICGRECENKWGNNPYPVVSIKGATCCNKCNDEYVISARLIMMSTGKKPTIEEIKRWNRGE